MILYIKEHLYISKIKLDYETEKMETAPGLQIP